MLILMRTKGCFHNEKFNNEHLHDECLYNDKFHKYHLGSDHKSNGIVYYVVQAYDT